jgi:ribose-phosphate pyrophosphokinase
VAFRGRSSLTASGYILHTQNSATIEQSEQSHDLLRWKANKMAHFSLFCGTSNPALGRAIGEELECQPCPSRVEVFPDGEISVRLEKAVRRRPLFVVQPTAPPVTNNLFQLMLFVDACRRAGAGGITAVVPYFGYARSDKRHGRREAITASMVAALLESVGVNHLITLDLHSSQIEGFFRISVDHLTAVPPMWEALKEHIAPETVVVSPDEGRVKMATQYAQLFGLSVAVVHKQRTSGTETHAVKVAGDVCGRPCLIIDDMISTGGTIAEAVKALLGEGAKPEMQVAATHGVFTPGAREKLSMPELKGIWVTDSIAQPDDWPELHVVSVAPLLASSIRRQNAGQSMQGLFEGL